MTVQPDHNAFILPPGNVQIAFSGGRTSAYMLHRILEANGGLPDRVQVTFQNTGLEMPQTLDFVQEVSERWGVNIVWLEYRPSRTHPINLPDEVWAAIARQAPLAGLAEWIVANATDDLFEIVSHNASSRNGEPFAALVLRRKYLPNQQARFCTMELKVRTAKRYLRSLGWDRWVNCVGLRADEPHRLNKPAPKDRWTVWSPLALAGIGRAVVSAFWAAQAFDLRLPNVNGNCWLGNCNCCFLKSEANVAAFTRDFPLLAAWWEAMEAVVALIASKPSGAAFSKRYTRKSVREMVEAQGDWIFNDEAYLCQKSAGECFG